MTRRELDRAVRDELGGRARRRWRANDALGVVAVVELLLVVIGIVAVACVVLWGLG